MKVLLLQLNPLVGDLAGNSEKIIASYQQANEEGVDLILTPELSLWGYPPRDLLFDTHRLKEQKEILNYMADKIRIDAPDCSLIVGIAEQSLDRLLPNLFNSLVLVANGKWEIVARKQLLPTYDVFDEKRYFRPFSHSSTINIKTLKRNWKLGLTICEDLWVEENLQGQRLQGANPIEQLKESKVDILINLSASPFSQSKKSLRQNLAAKASTNLKCPVIYLNQVGGNDELVFDGASFVMNSSSKVVYSLPSYKETIGVWDTSRQTQSKLSHANNQEYIFRALVLGVKDYCAKCGFNSALLGLSGGIDSALVATIATAALGSRNITSILMPSPWSSSGSIDDALALSKRLAIQTKTIPINTLMDCYDSTLAIPLGERLKALASENLQSRIRGTILMAIANQNNHLLLSTGNKSELAMGYCTLYGDMNGGLSVIGDLYKTSVFKVCEWLDSNESANARKKLGLFAKGELIGEIIRTKPPSAELRPDQLDTDSLPPYEILDPILKGLIEERQSQDKLIKKGYDKDLIQKIQSLLKKSEFKRRQAPPLLKISNQAFGSGWRVPIASK
ncbi:NAD+ synthase [Prochlorococcus sp. MIT 1223]|uniref:NAD+ synthase n=1 Tax=Prochlorococcus sp. MIT 1223 TaxID=3096217 RepID=UPI002A75125D|nr:NAD+ synthase [Prochlorococcus sp. MIT 1223]